MTGLEKIIKEIETKAKADADRVIAEAEKEANAIYAEAKAKASKRQVEIAEQSEIKIKSVLGRAESAAKLQAKKILLYEKQKLISEIITKAKEKLLNLSDSDYFELTLQMIKKHAQNEHGKIIFSKKDKERIPEDYQTNIKKALSEFSKASLTVAEETADFHGGFIIVYGDIEVNLFF